MSCMYVCMYVCMCLCMCLCMYNIDLDRCSELAFLGFRIAVIETSFVFAQSFRVFQLIFFPTKLCGALVFRSAPPPTRSAPRLPRVLTYIHTHNNFVTHTTLSHIRTLNFSHTTFSHTQQLCHTQLCHTHKTVIHNFVTHNL